MTDSCGGPQPAGIGSRVLAGCSSWGFVQVSYARHWVCHRLVVYPPGTTSEQRRWMRVRRMLPAVLTIAVLGSLYAGALSGLGAVGAVGLAVAVGGTLAIVVGARTSRVHHGMRAVEAWSGDLPDATSASLRAEICRISGELRDADDALRSGAIDPATHEMIWARCYAEVPVASGRQHAEAGSPVKRPG